MTPSSRKQAFKSMPPAYCDPRGFQDAWMNGKCKKRGGEENTSLSVNHEAENSLAGVETENR